MELNGYPARRNALKRLFLEARKRFDPRYFYWVVSRAPAKSDDEGDEEATVFVRSIQRKHMKATVLYHPFWDLPPMVSPWAEISENEFEDLSALPGLSVYDLYPPDRCPKCRKGKMVECVNSRDGSRFKGCSLYPKCKFSS